MHDYLYLAVAVAFPGGIPVFYKPWGNYKSFGIKRICSGYVSLGYQMFSHVGSLVLALHWDTNIQWKSEVDIT